MPIESQKSRKNKDEEYDDESNTTRYSTANRQAFADTEQVLFELASAERLSILSRLGEEKAATNNLSTLSKDLNIVVQEIHRHISRLSEVGLIQKTSANSYSLTAFGTVMLTQIPALNFPSKNKSFFSDHILGELPLKFIQRLGALSDSLYLDNQVAVFEYQREIISKAQSYLYIIIPQMPHLGILVNESQSIVMFPVITKKGSAEGGERREGQLEINMNSGFYSTGTVFHEWCLDYFSYMWQTAKPYNPNKLNEV